VPARLFQRLFLEMARDWVLAVLRQEEFAIVWERGHSGTFD